jgi:hypothetical protein
MLIPDEADQTSPEDESQQDVVKEKAPRLTITYDHGDSKPPKGWVSNWTRLSDGTIKCTDEDFSYNPLTYWGKIILYPGDEGFAPLDYDKIPVMCDTPSEEQSWGISFGRTDVELQVELTDNTFATKINKQFTRQRYDSSLGVGWAIVNTDSYLDSKGKQKIIHIDCVGPKDSLSLAAKCADDPELSKTAWPSPIYSFHEDTWKGSNPKKEDSVMQGRSSDEQQTEIVGARNSFWAKITTTDNTMLTWIRKMCAANPFDPKKNPTGWRMERLGRPDKEHPIPKGCPTSERIVAWCPKGCIRFRGVRMDLVAKAIKIRSDKEASLKAKRSERRAEKKASKASPDQKSPSPKPNAKVISKKSVAKPTKQKAIKKPVAKKVSSKVAKPSPKKKAKHK